MTANGKRYARHAAPLQEVGVLLEARSIQPGRSAFNHLMALAYTHGIPRRRVDEVIELTGLQSVAKRRAGAFSLVLGQRLGIAAALLGDPHTVMRAHYDLGCATALAAMPPYAPSRPGEPAPIDRWPCVWRTKNK